MKKAAYPIIYSIWYAISLLPLWVLYRISDLLYVLVYNVVGYRKKLVRKHLADSFPEKSGEERLRIEKEFYAWFCDYAVESIKLLSISKGNLMQRMRFENVDIVKGSFDRGRNVSLFLGHYCNWEWVSSIPVHFDGYHAKVMFGQIYHKLENEAMDKVFLKLRGRMGAVSIPMAETLRKIVECKKQKKLWIVGFIADQSPFWNNIHLWLDFMHHDTPVFTGPERIAHKFDTDVYYLDVRRESRGHYVARYELMSEHPSALPEFELTRMYFRMLEKSLHRQPPFYLWTHNRWKRTHEEYNIRYDAETGRVDMGDLNEIKRRKGIM